MSWRKWLGLEEEPKKIEERTPQTLQVGDVVSYQDENYIVEQRVEYHGDGGDVWWDFLVVNPKEKFWLGVVEDEGLELTLYHNVGYRPPMPPPTELEYEGEKFHRSEYGFADAIIKKKSRLTNTGRVEYWDYDAESGKSMSVERWGINEVKEDQSRMTGTITCSIGTPIKPYMVTIFPGNPDDQ